MYNGLTPHPPSSGLRFWKIGVTVCSWHLNGYRLYMKISYEITIKILRCILQWSIHPQQPSPLKKNSYPRPVTNLKSINVFILLFHSYSRVVTIDNLFLIFECKYLFFPPLTAQPSPHFPVKICIQSGYCFPLSLSVMDAVLVMYVCKKNIGSVFHLF